MSGQTISFAGNGKSLQGYLATPQSGSGPGVIVIQEWWGLVPHIKRVADRFADAGFTALAPDFYEGRATTEPDEAGSLMMALDIANAERILHGAVTALLERPEPSSEKVGVVGFCMGGQLALFAATIDEKIGAAVDYYGIHPNVKPVLANLRCPLLGFFAEHDTYASPEAVLKLNADLSAAGKFHEFKTYTGAHHAFFNDERPAVYHEAAASDSWARMIEFFRRHLG